MADGDIYAERLGRHAIEAHRMDDQFRIITRALGWTLHPSVTRNLDQSPSIADFATGTGLFLRSLAKTYPNAARLDGYDLSPEMFVSDGKVKLSVADVKKPMPTELHGLYDVLHLRWLIAGMEPDDWEPVLRNLLPLLKPGGAIQWVEPAFSQTQHLRGEPESKTATLTKMSLMFRSGPLQQRFSHGWSTLPAIMEKCGLRVETDLVSSDRVVGTRRALTENGLVALLGFARIMASKQAPGAMSMAEIDAVEAKAKEEIESGCYLRYDVHTAVGFKPDDMK
ncbi:MAG: hypothetical protein LQ348_004663 [Seirophora lacunosa]|nr:MAG: hypothetical protein LQ348_004663 [Seirophora lacunosa]